MRYLARVQSPWMPNIVLPSPRQATTRRPGEASVTPMAAPRPQPKWPAEELEKYDRPAVNSKLDMRTSLLVGLSLTINASRSKSLSNARTSRAGWIGVSSQPSRALSCNSAWAASLALLRHSIRSARRMPLKRSENVESPAQDDPVHHWAEPQNPRPQASLCRPSTGFPRSV